MPDRGDVLSVAASARWRSFQDRRDVGPVTASARRSQHWLISTQVVREEQVDLTDKALRVFFFEGCGCVDAATEKCRRALPLNFERAFVTGATGSTVVLEAPDKKLLEREDVLTFHVAKVFGEMKAKPFSLPEKFIVPLTKTPPTLPEVKLDDCDSRRVRGLLWSRRGLRQGYYLGQDAAF